MGALHTQWKDAKKKVTGIDPLFTKNLGSLLDKADTAYAEFKKDEKDLGKVLKRVEAVNAAVDKATSQVKEYKTLIQNTKAKPSKTKAISLFMDREKDILKQALTGIQTALNGQKADAAKAHIPTVDELKAFKGQHTKDVLKMSGL